MGGDLVDALGPSGEVVGYVADVSGHGIAAGVLMAVVKSAMRTHLLTPRPLIELLRDLNTVLPAMKDAARYVTLAAVRIRASGLVEYALAGHPPILHFSRRTRSIARLSTPQMPLGMFPEVQYIQESVHAEPGDLIVLLTDGLIETANAADEEFGLERLCAVVKANADRRPSEIVDAVLSAVRSHGRQSDDQSLLVLAVRDRHDEAGTT
jgi:serine phosphatase RsbU (regulator of sigma subunit)